jgi:hypothetical protein
MTIKPVMNRDDPQLIEWYQGERLIINQMIENINQRRLELQTFAEALEREHASLEQYHNVLDKRTKLLTVLFYGILAATILNIIKK